MKKTLYITATAILFLLLTIAYEFSYERKVLNEYRDISLKDAVEKSCDNENIYSKQIKINGNLLHEIKNIKCIDSYSIISDRYENTITFFIKSKALPLPYNAFIEIKFDREGHNNRIKIHRYIDTI